MDIPNLHVRKTRQKRVNINPESTRFLVRPKPANHTRVLSQYIPYCIAVGSEVSRASIFPLKGSLKSFDKSLVFELFSIEFVTRICYLIWFEVLFGSYFWKWMNGQKRKSTLLWKNIFRRKLRKNFKVGVVRLVQSNHGTQQDKLSSLLFCFRTKHKKIVIKVHGSECIARTVAGLRL